MKISVVTISFNQAKFLERTIRSVLAQNYNDLDYVIVDPGSTDGSREIINKYREQLGTVIFEPDDGPADGLNKGFKAAKGEVFAQLNADDCYLPGTLKRVAETFKEHPNAGAVYAHGFIVDEDGVPTKRFFSDPFDINKAMFGGVTVCQQSTFYKSEAFNKVGGFNWENTTSWDGELLVDFALHDIPMVRVHDYWGVFSLYADSISGSQRFADKSTINHERIFQKVMGRPRTPEDLKRLKWSRLTKWKDHPWGLFWRLMEALNGKTPFVSSEYKRWMSLTENQIPVQ